MALSTQSTALQLVAGTLGSQARLQAGMEHLFIDQKTPDVRIALFRGPRPSQLEIDNHAFILEGERLGYSSFIGIWEMYRHYYTQLTTRHNQYLGDADYATGKGESVMPSEPTALMPNDEQDFFHAIFPRHYRISRRSSGSLVPVSTEGLELGNGAAPTWGLVSFHSSVNAGVDNSVTQHGTELSLAELFTPAAKRRPFTILAPRQEFNHYITVGDWRDEPEANLTLYRGAEAGQATSPGTISPQRLRMRLNPVQSVPMGI